MPKRTDITNVLLIGAGPIVIGQACEFDYSGTQACRALKEEGLRVVLLNSNPATIMTDPQLADATYIEPITASIAEAIIEREGIDAVLPTMGGQTALNHAMQLHNNGALERHNVKLIGASFASINAAENREAFRQLMAEIGLETARAGQAYSMKEAQAVAAQLGTFPLIIRPSFTLGGAGGGIANNMEEFNQICARGLHLSPTNQLLIEESLAGWKEFELEVIRDRKDNCIVVCGIENIDPLGVHTGDSVTVAPCLTLTDKEYQCMRAASFKVMRAIGVDTGGANVQFAVNPENGRQLIIEMNPRVSRSSALASKATGFPIAKVSTKLALGYTLDELRNDITAGATPVSFEPTIDYVVTKMPRFDFDKFPQTLQELGTQMKSVGEVMALGRTFTESLQKTLNSLEIGLSGLDPQVTSKQEALKALCTPKPNNLLLVADALRHGASVAEVNAACGIDNWFINEIKHLVQVEHSLAGRALAELDAAALTEIKRDGFSDLRLATLLDSTEREVRARRYELGVHASYKRVDSCAAEFPTTTAYQYSTYGEDCEANPSDKNKIMILGSGPNRIGQGIEFDYCCTHAALALREQGFETIMVNCNPETVSTDYDISDRLYFEPVTVEHVLEILRLEKPQGLIVQYGGQTPLSIASELGAAGAPIIGTSIAAIDRAEDRDRFRQLLRKLNLRQPDNEITNSVAKGLQLAQQLGFPLVVRPSYVIGGKAMEIIQDRDELRNYLERCSSLMLRQGILLDRFLDKAIEIDVDAICDGKQVVVPGILEHVEKAGIHSGDSSCTLPPHSVSTEVERQLREQTTAMALELGVLGLMNVQFAIQDGNIYVLEINPRASRTVPFISKAIGWPVAHIGALVMTGKSLAELGFTEAPKPYGFFVKEAVFPFDRMPGSDTLLGPEMRSTGEVMGCGNTYSAAFLKATEAIAKIPETGIALLSVRDEDKATALPIALELANCGMGLAATEGTAAYLNKHGNGIKVEKVHKVTEKPPTVVDVIKNGKVSLVINTVRPDAKAIIDSADIRRAALAQQVLYFTTIDSARVIVTGIKERLDGHSKPDQIMSLQQRYRRTFTT